MCDLIYGPYSPPLNCGEIMASFTNYEIDLDKTDLTTVLLVTTKLGVLEPFL